MAADTGLDSSNRTGGHRVRACLVDLPVMLDEIVRDALCAAGVEIVAEPAVLVRMSEGGDEAAVLITAQSAGGGLGRLRSLLRAAPDVAILAVAVSGSCATLWELWPVERTLGELSESLIIATLDTVTPWNRRLPATSPL